MSNNQTYRHISYAVLRGNQVIAIGTEMALGVEQLQDKYAPHTLVEIDPSVASHPLPAYWDDIEGIIPLPESPGLDYEFNYGTLQWVPELSKAWARVRATRNKLIAATDWRATRAVVENRRLHPAWEAYRTELRDITSQPDPFTIPWPAIPTAPTFADEDPNEYPIFVGNAKFEIFTEQERTAILSEAQTDTHIMLLINRMTGAAYISYADPEMELGLSLLVHVGLLTQKRKDAIVQTMLPLALRG